MNTPTSLNTNIRELQPSATLAINEQCQRLKDTGQPVYRLGFGQSPFPVPAAVVAALRDNAHQKAYLPTQGLPELRQAVADYMMRTEGINYTASQIMVGPGSKELMFLLQLTYEAQLLLPAPTWVSYAPQAAIIGREVCWLQSDLDKAVGLDPQVLEQHCQAEPGRTRLLVLNYPSNPTGNAYTAEQLQALADIARRHQLLVLSDEIYSGLNFEDQHISIARFYPEGTIVSNGLSKWCGAGGWRLGVFAFPTELAWLQEAMAALVTETFSAVAAPVQYAAVEAFSDTPEMQRYLADVRRIMGAVMTHICGQLRRAGALVCDPRGGFYLFPRFDCLQGRAGCTDSATLCQRLLQETGVALLPGSDFGRPPGELSARLAGVDFDGGAALAALAELPAKRAISESFLRDHCGNILEGVDRLCQWLQTGTG
jgi:aspartate aminotransferase